jgi:thioredoxin 2
MSTDTARYVVVPCQFCDTRNKVNMERVSHRPKCRNEECGRPILLDRPFPLRDDTFADVIAHADVPVLVDFYADWCGPCKAMAPVLDAIAGELAGRVLVAKVNTDATPIVSQQHQIRSIPTLMVFQSGQPVAQQMGALPRAQLLQLLQQAGVSV